MIQLRKYSVTSEEGEYIDLTEYQVELVTDDGIERFLGRRGIMMELRSENDIFDKEHETIRKMSMAMEKDTAEIYFGSENSDYERYIISFTGDNMAKLYMAPDREEMYDALLNVADFIENVVCPDKHYLPILEPVDVGIMCICAYYLEDHGYRYNSGQFRTIFNNVFDQINILEKPLPDYNDPYAIVEGIMDKVCPQIYK